VKNLHLRALVLASAAAVGFPANSATPITSFLTQQPMGSGIDSSVVKPNVMWLFDSSGSMGDDYLPDDDPHSKDSNGYYPVGYYSSQCNGVYFDPTQTYAPSMKADGTSNSPATWSASLPNNFYYQYNGAHGTGGTKQSPMSYTVNSADGTTDKSTPFYTECNVRTNDSTTNGVGTAATHTWTQIAMSSQSAAQQQSFANWYTYYRTRMQTMKTVASIAINQLANPDRLRIGFSDIYFTSSSTMLKIAPFCSASPGCTQRTSFFNTLNGLSASGNTPTREALYAAGLMYQGLLTGSGTSTIQATSATDITQYHCQRNSVILSTDGFWNIAPSTNAPFKFKYGSSQAGTATVGDTDVGGPGGEVLPYKDTLGASDTLADIAEYFWHTPITHSGLWASSNVISPTAKDSATWSHVNTYTLGLGADGIYHYVDGYETSGTCPDYDAIKAGTKAWEVPITTNTSGDATHIDDLWHAAVNGRGTYYRASSVSSLVNGLVKAFAEAGQPGGGGAAATGNLAPSAGNNSIYFGSFNIDAQTGESSGDVREFAIDPKDGSVPDPKTATPAWSAQAQLDTQVTPTSDSRTIYMATGSAALGPFLQSNLTAAIANGWFDAGATNPNGALSQYAFFSTPQQANVPTSPPAARGLNMIAYLRGQTGFEDAANNLTEANSSKIFRGRKHALGDIVGSSPAYVQSAPFDYTDTAYSAYKTSTAGRQAMVYAGANDGMLHAFDASTGVEQWAFVPTAVLPYLYKLADKGYAAAHRYFVNGPITVGDAYFGGNWHTVLISGLGGGGRAFFALDITTPATPKLLWEFSAQTTGGVCVGTTGTTCDQDLGYTYGNAPIAKLNGGQWVAFFGSGYYNLPASPTPPSSPPLLAGDGKSRLYVVDVATGAKISEILTTDGRTDPTETGLTWVNGWTDDGMHDNSVKHVYGGDLFGSVWRFNIAANSATLLTQLGNAVAGDEPVTTRPALGDFNGDVTKRVVYIGTGKYLGCFDTATPCTTTPGPTVPQSATQSFYAIRDDGTKANVGGAGLFRASGAQKFDTSVGSVKYYPVTSNQYGWYMDFATPNERVTVNPQLYGDQKNITVVTNIPGGDVCSSGGSSWVYFLDTQPAKTYPSPTNSVVSVLGASSLSAGATNLTLESGRHVTVVTTTSGSAVTVGGDTPVYGNKARRVSWRELKN